MSEKVTQMVLISRSSSTVAHFYWTWKQVGCDGSVFLDPTRPDRARPSFIHRDELGSVGYNVRDKTSSVVKTATSQDDHKSMFARFA